VAALVAYRRVGGPAAHGEVAAVENHLAVSQAGEPDDPVRGSYVLEFVALIGGHAGEFADLLERALVGQQLDTFPDRQLAPTVLLRDAGLAAHLLGELAASPQLLDLSFPDHGSSSSAAERPEAGASRRMPARRPAHPVSAAQAPGRRCYLPKGC